MRKVLGVIVAVALVFVSGLIFVGCEDRKDPNREGVVCGVSFATGISEWEVETQAVERGKKATEPAFYLREGYVLVGWKCGDRMWNFGVDTVQESIELEAVWEVDLVSWEYTLGLGFGYNELTDTYSVFKYIGEEDEVKIPLYYNGAKGIKKVTGIDSGVFAGLEITKVTLPTSIQSIGDGAFAGTLVASIDIPISLKNISLGAFRNMPELTTVKFLNQVDPITIGDNAFTGCVKLENLLVADNVYEIGDESFKDSGLKSVIFGSKSTLSSIGDRAFSGTEIVNFEIPDTVVEIGEEVFKSCDKLETVVVPSSLTQKGNDVFLECSKLEGIFYSQDLPSWASDISWTGKSVLLQYAYSKHDQGSAGFWKYSTRGVPTPHKEEVTLSFDMSALCETFKNDEDYGDYVVVVRQMYTTGNGEVLRDLVVNSIDNNGFVNIIIDGYGLDTYSVEIYYGRAESPEMYQNPNYAKGELDSTRNSVRFTEFNALTCTMQVEYIEQ